MLDRSIQYKYSWKINVNVNKVTNGIQRHLNAKMRLKYRRIISSTKNK